MSNFIDLIKAVFLGVVEGLTEFIPVSSTAHLLISSYLIDFQSIKNNLFEIVIQIGAIFAICVIYRKKILEVIFNLKEKKSQKFVLNLIIAFLPAAIIGGLFHGLIKEIFFSNLVIAIALILGGIFMIFIEKKFYVINSQSFRHLERSERSHESCQEEISRCARDDEKGEDDVRGENLQKSMITNIDNISIKKSFLIGIFQSIAMIPGVSRSGATIIGGLLLKLDRKTAAEFSFFLAIPTIAAATIFDLYKNFSSLTFSNIELILVGLISAFISALLVIKWFINFVSKNNFIPFGVYRIMLGIIILVFVI